MNVFYSPSGKTFCQLQARGSAGPMGRRKQKDSEIFCLPVGYFFPFLLLKLNSFIKSHVSKE